MVTVNHIVKTYNKGSVHAVHDISFSVEKGELFGLIGPDGAGKTSIFRILTTLLLADKGDASVNGLNVVRDYRAIRNCIGYMPGKFSLYQDLTVGENLNFFAALFGTTVRANYDLVKDIYEQIEPFKTRRAGKLSGGMKQKLALCCALIHKPVVLFLDEPTTGVDAVSRKEFWDMLKRLKAQGITILVSTPYMDEAVRCDRIALIQSGKILSIDAPEKIMQQYPEKLYALKADSMYELLRDLRNDDRILSANAFGEWVHLSFKDDAENNPSVLLDFLRSKGHTDPELKPVQPGIEDCFIRLLK